MSDTRALLARGLNAQGRTLSSAERESLAAPLLSAQSVQQAHRAQQKNTQHAPRLGHRATLINHLRILLHRLIFHLIQLTFSIYILLRQTYHSLHDRTISILYHHHRTPELIRRDVRNLSRLPQHLSVILSLSTYSSSNDASASSQAEALTALLHDAASIAAWCACAGIPTLSIYERTGALKSHIPALHRTVAATFRTYFAASAVPELHIRAPNHPAYSPPVSPTSLHPVPTSPSAAGTANETRMGSASDSGNGNGGASPTHLHLLLLSATDGRDTLIDLTKTLTEMAQKGKVRTSDISSELIDAELTAASCGEPDLLILMAAPAWREDTVGRRKRGARFRAGGSGGGAAGAGKRRTRRGSGRSEGGRGLEGHGDEDVDEGYASGAAAAGTGGGGGGAGGDVCLMGYPPWQVRLTEIFHVQDNAGVGYQVFLRGLHKYAKAEMRFGR